MLAFSYEFLRFERKEKMLQGDKEKKTKASIIRTAELARPGLTSPLLLSA